MLRFGQTLFGGFVLKGIVAVSGTALAVASVSGDALVTQFAAVNASAKASAQGKALRTQISRNNPVAQCDATATARPKGNYLVHGLAAAIATATGKPHYNAVVHIDAHGVATASGKGTKIYKQYPYHANAFATLQGTGYVFEFATPMPARAYAYLVGTTYFVGHVNALAVAHIFGTQVKIAGVKGVGNAVATATGDAHFMIGGAGVALGEAIPIVDSMVLHNGVRYWSGSVRAKAYAKADGINPISYQPQNGYAYGDATGYCLHTHGAKGHGYGIATGAAAGFDASTGAETLPALAYARVSAKPFRSAHAKANAQAKALCSTAKQAIVKKTNAAAKPAQAKALIQAKAYRTFIAKPRAATALTTTNTRGTRTRINSGLARAFGTLNKPRIQLIIRVDYANAYALTNVEGLRIAQGEVLAQAIATATGYNQVNDLTPAPEDRTVIVVYVEREYVVPEQPRTVII